MVSDSSDPGYWVPDEVSDYLAEALSWRPPNRFRRARANEYAREHGRAPPLTDDPVIETLAQMVDVIESEALESPRPVDELLAAPLYQRYLARCQAGGQTPVTYEAFWAHLEATCRHPQ